MMRRQDIKNIFLDRYKWYIIVAIFLAYSFPAFGQDKLNNSTKTKLQSLHAEILFPLDSKYDLKVHKIPRNSFAKEDIRLSYGPTDILVFLYPFKTMKFDFPHLEFHRVLTHLASNASEDHIFIYGLPESDIVDWAGEARFKVKNKVSQRNHATAQGFFKEGKGMYIVVYLDSKLQTEFNEVIRFVEDTNLRQE